ncbi:MAG: aldo/keto reductase [Gemmatimonadales bacterium]|nr:MAG: aldo/keto reductase [Gemmatimonadales bacterium]
MSPSPIMSRRDALKAGALAAAGIALAPLVPGSAMARLTAAAKPRLERITRPIPSTGERIPVIGLGTNQYSVETAEEMAQLQAVLEAMAEHGASVVDTARAYGRAEEVIGELLQRMGNREDFFIATKTPIRGELQDPDVEIRTSFDQLGVETLDLMLIHNLHGVEELMPAFIRWKDEGRIRYIGMSTSVDGQYAAQMEGMRRFPLDFIQVDYSIANRSAAEEILPLAEDLGIAVLVNVPFGGRGGGAASTFGRVADRELPDWAAEIDAESWAQVFLKYVVSHPAVTAAIPGTTQVRHLVDNQGAGRGRLPDPSLRAEIARFWDGLA